MMNLNSDREPLSSKLPPGTLSHPQAVGVWNMYQRCGNPDEVKHTYRSYKESTHCSVPRDRLRAMRNVMMDSMRTEE